MEDAKRWAPSIWQSRWPKYIGCAAAAHEGLAGGLVGAAGALFAAWLAFDAIQEQLGQERERVRDEITVKIECSLRSVIGRPMRPSTPSLPACTRETAAHNCNAYLPGRGRCESFASESRRIAPGGL